QAKWGVWGEWSECSAICGGCGRRSRVRGCYGGDRKCRGIGYEKEPCNIQACPVSPVTKKPDICNGRILLPCFLMEKLTFGERRQ
ncbi:thrombospondin type 1 domain protein, partial [Cooperia oncophora]